jgi:hypothetical protein
VSADSVTPARSARFHKPDEHDDPMNANDEDVIHPGSYQNLKKTPEFRPIL